MTKATTLKKSIAIFGLALAVSLPVGGPQLGIGSSLAQTVRKFSNVCSWNRLEWNQMTVTERNTWTKLGWNQTHWDRNWTLRSEKLDWDELSEAERNAAEVLGYTERTWEKAC